MDAGTDTKAVSTQPEVAAPAPAAPQTQAQVQQPQQAQAQGQMVPLLIPMAALAVFFVVLFIRAMPWKESTMTKKPWSCDACMSAWISIGFGIYLGTIGGAPWAIIHMLPAAGLAVLLLALQSRMKFEDLTPPR